MTKKNKEIVNKPAEHQEYSQTLPTPKLPKEKKNKPDKRNIKKNSE